MKNKMLLKQKTSARINLKKAVIYTLIGGTVFSSILYFGLTLLGVIGTPEKAMAAQVTGYSWDAVISIDHTKVHGQSNLIDFPLLISITDATLKSTTNGGKVINQNGYDVVFADMNNNQLDHQIESYNPQTGEYLAWVKIPSLSPLNNTDIKMFFGNTNISSNTSTDNTFNVNYEGVWHMNDNPANSVLNDGAGGNDAEDFGGMGANNLIVGKIGQSINFDGNNDYYAIKNKKYNGIGVLPKLTVSGWFRTTFNANGWTSNWSLLDFDRSEYFNVFVHGNGKIGFSTRGSGSGAGINDLYAGNAGDYNDGLWHCVTAVYNGIDKYIYVDGILKATKINAHAGQPLGKGTTRYGFIGAGSEATTYNGGRNPATYKGDYDEIRFLKIDLSAEWIATEYANQNSPSDFYSVAFSGGALPVKLINFDVKLVDGAAEIGWTTETEINNDFFTIEKSTDAVNFEVVDDVNGAGNHNGILNYNYIDDNVLEGISYYRLKQTDFDGKFEYFPPKSINASQNTDASFKITTAKPNPFTNQFTLEISSENEGMADFMIMDMNGTQVHSAQINLNQGSTSYSFNEGNKLTPGTYLINVIMEGAKATYKVIKN